MTQKKHKRHIITAALPYANGAAHIGHLAGVYIPADIYARYLRLKGEDVMFVSGSDEHGVPVTIRAEKEGVTVQQVVDKYDQVIRDSFKEFGFTFDVYSRTSRQIHHETSQEFFLKLHAEGKLQKKVSQQFFDPTAQRFLADRLIIGTCPKCGNDNAYGDQCENCGSTLSPDELIDPRSTLSNAALEKKETEHWYIPLDQYEDWLKDWILDSHKDDWKTNVYGQCKSWLDSGLHPRAVTRDLDWGIQVPLPNSEGKVMYVWFDAPIGYISATKEYFKEKAPDGSLDEEWKKYWQSEDSKLVHFIGKDNIVFHCIMFPSMLKAHGEYVLPENVPANEFMNLEDEKISTSRNWAVWLHEYLREFEGKQDVLRYALTADAPETSDSNFTWEGFQKRNNNELADNLGNFVRRPVALTHKYYGGVVPPLNDNLTEDDQALIDALAAYPKKIGKAIEEYKFREALAQVMDLSRMGNQYLQKTSPWLLYKEDKEKHAQRIETILHLSLQVAANLALLCEPFLPFTAEKLRNMLNRPAWNPNCMTWQAMGGIDIINAGQTIEKAIVLFEKIEDKTVKEQLDKLAATKQANAADQKEAATTEATLEPIKDEIVFDDFTKLDIRVATIVEAKKVKKADRLLELTLDTGVDTRTVLSGIAQHFKPEDIVGKQVCLLANLAPRKMKGIESQGMVLMAEDSEGNLKFVSPTDAVNNGSTVR
ncbi:methionine--tRNA ligase [Microscilla marina]|uniref:Methionine--tRNA ligase n=1 Tax=Microscilla marina ATCC 23134 TaxID=313606 RepID=A1ZHE0_MICM2|nr:methionine--tRNA ligase [Microscilla marina]EAY30409.1 methionyl-tRNA synthetase [Microscilla marina ATCC 23134]